MATPATRPRTRYEDTGEAIAEVIRLQRDYHEACASLISRYPELLEIVRDGKAFISRERRMTS